MAAGPVSTSWQLLGQLAHAELSEEQPALGVGELPRVEPSHFDAGPRPGYHWDYVKLAAWLFAIVLGPGLAALIVILVS